MDKRITVQDDETPNGAAMGEVMSDENKKTVAVTYDTDSGPVTLNKSVVIKWLANGEPDFMSDADVGLFMKLCEARQLNPFLREAYLIKYKKDFRAPATMVVSKDVFMKRAALFPDFDGMQSGVIVTDNETGDLREREGEFYLKTKEELVGAWAVGFRKDWNHEMKSTVSLEEYIGRKSSGEPNKMWAGKPGTMLVKVAEVHLLRKIIPEILPGMYIPEEMNVEAELETKPVKVARAELEIPDEETARAKFTEIIERYQYVMDEGVVEQARLEFEGCDTLDDMRMVFLNFQDECKAAEREAEKVEKELTDAEAAKELEAEPVQEEIF